MNRGVLYYLMIPLVIIAGLLQSTATSRIEVSGVKPDMVLLLVVIGTLLYGSRPGIAWAFVGGIALDLFSGGPMGGSSLALMAAAVVAGIGHRTLSRYNLVVPIGAIVTSTIVYAFTYLLILAALGYFRVAEYSLPLFSTLQYIIIPALVYNASLMLLAIPFLNRLPESQDI